MDLVSVENNIVALMQMFLFFKLCGCVWNMINTYE